MESEGKPHSGSDLETLRTRDLNLGNLLNSRYLIEKEIGRGGNGVVYLARDQQLLAKPVVVKVLRSDLLDPDQYGWIQMKFRQEIEALARIDHPGVVGVLDAGETTDGRPFLVMQFVEGFDLRSIMSVQGMEFARAARIIRQIGHALSAAHERGIYHRDLKPENIMLQSVGDGEEYVKLIDFGIATVQDSKVGLTKHTTRVAGTFAYMAPEQLEGAPEAASDIFALGVIAYEMLTGQLPFSAKSAVELYGLQRRASIEDPCVLRHTLPESARTVLLKALSFIPSNRYSKARDLGEALALSLTGEADLASRSSLLDTVSIDIQTTGSEPTEVLTSNTSVSPAFAATARWVALLYKRNASPDDYVLSLLESQLIGQGHRVFVDRHLSIGIEWAREIERQVRTADAVIPLLSASSITSEMLAYEIQIAHDAAQKQNGKPRILPIRIAYEGALPGELSSMLDPIQYAMWRGPEDDARLLNDVQASIAVSMSVEPTIAPRKIEAVGDAVPLGSDFYVIRQTDDDLHNAIQRRDSIVLIKGARQMGKTSLLARGLQQARKMGARVVLTDFQKLNASHLESVETLLMTLAEFIADQLDLEVYPDEVWNPRRGPSINFERYLRREVIGKTDCPLVWGMDEVDRLFSCDYASEIFGLFRSWHNERSLDPTGPWQMLTLAIAYATEAHLFITDVNQSPFNVGTRLALEDFSLDLVAELNRRYGSPLRSPAEVARFFEMTGGQPYLVRRGLNDLASRGMILAAFEEATDRDEGPFGDHLRRILVLLAQDEFLCDTVRGVLEGSPCPTMESFYRLRSAGILAGDSARDARLRCRLYTTYLRRHLL
ncbi:MAG TPA: AAA-like domain-containing protein [Blastocatellia bacterium]|nr:AAA-like domain-containing protein [Blastocatellia bacterium]